MLAISIVTGQFTFSGHTYERSSPAWEVENEVIPVHCITFFSLCTRSQVSVVSWNIRYDHAGDSLHAWADRKQPMADWLQNSGAEVIGIQEGLFHQVQFLDSVLTNLLTWERAGKMALRRIFCHIHRHNPVFRPGIFHFLAV